MTVDTSTQVSPRWEHPNMVANFRESPPNQVLLAYAKGLRTADAQQVLDLGCGAARNALPLARLGYHVVGTDLSVPMIEAAQHRAKEEGPEENIEFLVAPMTPLPLETGRFDLVVAHGIWNLARSDSEFRHALSEAARVARPGAHLFVFTFSRHTLPSHCEPMAGETLIFTQFQGEPQCFLTEEQLVEELSRVGFVRDSSGPLTEYNRPTLPRTLAGPPVIYEGTFVRS